MALLEVGSVNAFYGAVHALKGVSLAVEKGEILTLIGGNGAGKTTTLRVISGMVRPRNGTVKFDGQDITGTPPNELVGRGLVHVPEGRGIFANLTVAENLELGAYTRHDRAGIAADLERAFELFPRVKERQKQLAGTLSGGEQQMVAIARALLARPKLLLLDEPSLGLAPQLVATIFWMISGGGGAEGRGGGVFFLVRFLAPFSSVFRSDLPSFRSDFLSDFSSFLSNFLSDFSSFLSDFLSDFSSDLLSYFLSDFRSRMIGGSASSSSEIGIELIDSVDDEEPESFRTRDFADAIFSEIFRSFFGNIFLHFLKLFKNLIFFLVNLCCFVVTDIFELFSDFL